MMTLAIHDQRLAKPGPQNAALRDYDSVRRAIAFISENWRAQPTIEAMADAAGVTPDELHHLQIRHPNVPPILLGNVMSDTPLASRSAASSIAPDATAGGTPEIPVN